MARRGIRAGDLTNSAALAEKLARNTEQANRLLKMLGGELVDEKQLIEDGLRWSELLAPHVTDTTYYLNQATRQGKSLLLEGAQAVMLDIDHGTYPFVTSSSSAVGGACTGAGIPPSAINATIGVIKAYTTRVGGGPFPTDVANRFKLGVFNAVCRIDMPQGNTPAAYNSKTCLVWQDNLPFTTAQIVLFCSQARLIL